MIRQKSFNSGISNRDAEREATRIIKAIVARLPEGKIRDNRPQHPLQWRKEDFALCGNFFYARNDMKYMRLSRVAYGYLLISGIIDV